jgi:hypothetical protein
MLAFSSAVDALTVIWVALLALYAGGGSRAAVMAALLAGTLPFGLMVMMSWGIFPTLLGQCFSLLAAVVWLHLRPRLHERRAWLLLSFSLGLAFLSYPSALAFLGTTGAILLLLLALRRDPAALPTLKAGVLALGVVFALYYGWHIPAQVSSTLPTLLEEVPGAEGGTDEPAITIQRTLDALWLQLADKYGLLLLALAGGGALLLALRQPDNRPAHYAWLLLLAWALAYIPFALIDEYVVTIIVKQLVHILPVIAVLGGVLLGRLSRQRWGMVVAGVLLVLVFWQGLLLELEHIVHGFAELK